MRKGPGILLLAAVAAGAASAERIDVTVRDAPSGAPVAAAVEISPAGGEGLQRRSADSSGRLTLDLPAGAWRVAASSPRHRPLAARLEVGSGAPSRWTFELEPVAPVAPPSQETGGAEAGRARLVGVVRDDRTGEPIAGVDVRAESGGSTVTGADGRFELDLQASEFALGEAAGTTLRFAGSGRRELVLEGVLPIEGTTRLPVRLARGAGVDRRRLAHRAVDARDGRAGGPPPGGGETKASAGELAPPESVRVGFGDAGCSVPCCTAACTAVCVLPLETYVARGLNDEWISSWDGDSLRAGAVAYRSYAAHRVDHPSTPAFDLCSSACCQVNDPDTAQSTDAAVAATAGILLERNGAAFSAEYSAENNAWDDPEDGLTCSNSDLSCGDGAVGSPAANWPCLDDAVALGHGCFGHGRGMSQWGSMRWARDFDRTWRVLLDHYYNADGAPDGLRSATLASPVRIDGAIACPARVGPGDRLRFHLDATDLAALPHPAVRFGASVVAPGGEWISDPDDDGPAPLEPGPANRESRWFDLPADASTGLYDVALALWLDVDGDGAVGPADFRLDLDLGEEGLEVAAEVDLVFADCFESADFTAWSTGSQ